MAVLGLVCDCKKHQH